MSEAKVMVGVPTGGFSRNDHFYDYYNMLERENGTPCMFVRGQSPARNRNEIIAEALKLECTHIFFLDDDIAVKPDTIKRLLAHDKDIVTGLYLKRDFPNAPIIFDRSFDDGRCTIHFLDDNETGLIPIVNCGLGLVLIKIEVFKTIQAPWIRLGETELDHWGDDIGFFNRCRKAGFELFCDLSVTAGHMGNVIIEPRHENGKWVTAYYTNSSLGAISFPAVKPTPEQIQTELQQVSEEIAKINDELKQEGLDFAAKV